MSLLRLGLIVNPIAGMGGAVALKGTDGATILAEARARGAVSRVAGRVGQTLSRLKTRMGRFDICTYPGDMGATACADAGLPVKVVGTIAEGRTTAEDTRRAVADLQNEGIHVLLFAGGDGTARDICRVVAPRQVVLGIPCGVKMHSGVFAVDPLAAGDIVRAMIDGELVRTQETEVRDIDEEAFRAGKVVAKHFGELLTPSIGGFLQQVKVGGVESEELVAVDIAAELVEDMDADETYFVGSGSTTAEFMIQLGLPNTLLGFDVVRDGEVVVADAREEDLFRSVRPGATTIVISIIGGQGHILGRGNQQLSPRVIRKVGLEGIVVLGSRTKLNALGGGPLLADTGDPALDRELSGMIEVVTGYRDRVLYKVGLR